MRKDKYLVSIITPVYNSENYISRTIESVLKQTYLNWELIIVDDCSKDSTSNIVKSFNDARIKYIKLKKNQGAAAARNIALEKAKGQYIAFLDSDDEWKSKKVEKQLSFMVSKNAGFTFTSYEVISSTKNKEIKVPKTLSYSQFMKNTIIGTSTVMLNRGIIGEIKLVNIRQDHDSMTWAQLLREGNIAYGINESLSYYRKVDNSISSNKFKAARVHWKNCREIEGLPFIKCAYFFMFYAINAIKKHYF